MHTPGVSSINIRARAAQDPSATEDQLAAYATDASKKVRASVAGNPATPLDVLRTLADDPRWEVRYDAAENRRPHGVAVGLGSADPDTRGIAAMRDDLDAAAIERVLSDPHRHPRECLAGASSDPVVLARLARDPAPQVRASAAQNELLDRAELEKLTSDPHASVRASAAITRRLSAATVTRLARDRSSHVRWWTLVSYPDRLDIAEFLLDDPNGDVRDQARGQHGVVSE